MENNYDVLMLNIFVINLSNSFLKLEEELFCFLTVKSYCTSVIVSSLVKWLGHLSNDRTKRFSYLVFFNVSLESLKARSYSKT